MSLLFRSADGSSWPVEKCPTELLKWYATANNRSITQEHRDAAIDELSRRPEEPEEAKPPTASNRSREPKKSTALAKTDTASLTFALNSASEINERLALLEQQVNLVSPAMFVGEVPDGFQIVSSIVRVDTSVNSSGYVESDDLIHMGSGKFMLSGTALKRVQSAAGVSWSRSESGRTDDRSQMNYWEYTAVGYVSDLDGTKRRITGTYELDLRDGSAQVEEIFAQAKQREEKERKKNPKYEGDGGAAALRAKRRFGAALAETGAKNRALVDMGFKRTQKIEDWKKPIVAVRLMFTGRTEDPELRREFSRMLAAQAIGSSIPALYPTSEPRQLPAVRPIEVEPELVEGEVQ